MRNAISFWLLTSANRWCISLSRRYAGCLGARKKKLSTDCLGITRLNRGGLPGNLRGPLRVLGNPWNERRLWAGAFAEERLWLEGRRGAVSWPAVCELRPTYSLLPTHVWVCGIRGMWATALSSSLPGIIIPLYIMCTKRNLASNPLCKNKKAMDAEGSLTLSHRLWREERDTGSNVIEISDRFCKKPVGLFYPAKCAKDVRVSL